MLEELLETLEVLKDKEVIKAIMEAEEDVKMEILTVNSKAF